MNAAAIFERLNAHPILKCITLDGVVTLTRLASHLKRDILQPQSIPETNPDIAPTILPQPIVLFLSAAIGIPIDIMDECWEIFRDYIWDMPLAPLTHEDYQLFKHHGWQYGLSCVKSFIWGIMNLLNLTCLNSSHHDFSPERLLHEQ